MQPDLFTIYPNQPGWKSEGTSRIAAESIKPRAETLRERVYWLLQHHELTADETAQRLGLSVLSVRPRLSELNKMGKIVETNVRRRNESGVFAAVWRAI